MTRLAALSPVAFLLLAVACLGAMPAGSPATGPRSAPAPFDWVRPQNSVESKFEDAKLLAHRIIRQPRCREALEELPNWPPGRVVTTFPHAWEDGNNRRLARTIWRNESAEHTFIPPRIEIHEAVVMNRDRFLLAAVLIHELAHAASWGDFEGIEDETERAKALEANERRAQQVTGICTREAGIV